MPKFRIDLRDARPTNGHTGEPEVTLVTAVEAPNWYEARECAARRHGIAVMDPAMLVTPWSDDDAAQSGWTIAPGAEESYAPMKYARMKRRRRASSG